MLSQLSYTPTVPLGVIIEQRAPNENCSGEALEPVDNSLGGDSAVRAAKRSDHEWGEGYARRSKDGRRLIRSEDWAFARRSATIV